MGDLTGDFNHIFSDHPTGGMSYNDLYILFYKFYQLEKTTETSIDHFLHLYENQIPPPTNSGHCTFCGVPNCQLLMNVTSSLPYGSKIPIMTSDLSPLNQFVLLLLWHGDDDVYYNINVIIAKYKVYKTCRDEYMDNLILELIGNEFQDDQ